LTMSWLLNYLDVTLNSPIYRLSCLQTKLKINTQCWNSVIRWRIYNNWRSQRRKKIFYHSYCAVIKLCTNSYQLMDCYYSIFSYVTVLCSNMFWSKRVEIKYC
jgi:hypothetical protein